MKLPYSNKSESINQSTYLPTYLSIIAAVDVKIFWLRDRTNDHPIVHSHQCEMQTHENAMLSFPF